MMDSTSSPSNAQPNALLIPGAVTPAAISYGALLHALGDHAHAVAKDLELYAADKPPADYSLDTEVEGIRRAADRAGFQNFHLVGYSGGGGVSLAFTAKYPERLSSLALIEPAWIGNEGWTAEDRADWAELERAMLLPSEERMGAFIRWHMREGAEPPKPQVPPGPPPPWMALRPAGLDALSKAFKSYRLDRERFRLFRRPVYYAWGSLSRLFFERNGRTLGSLFADFRAEMYEGRSHFDPPHRAEPERVAQALRELWMRAGTISATS